MKIRPILESCVHVIAMRSPLLTKSGLVQTMTNSCIPKIYSIKSKGSGVCDFWYSSPQLTISAKLDLSLNEFRSKTSHLSDEPERTTPSPLLTISNEQTRT